MSGVRIPASSNETLKTGVRPPAAEGGSGAKTSAAESSVRAKTAVESSAGAKVAVPQGKESLSTIQNQFPGKIPAGKAAEPLPGSRAEQLFKETAAALGFPKDGLSLALLAFTRFFSLSPAALGGLRREFLAAFKDAPKTGLEAGALALAAALDKGVNLSPEALAHYARFFVPPDSGREQKPGGEGHYPAAGDGEDGENEDEEAPDGDKIKAIAGEETEKDGLLGLLNSLPGKNGQHWAVFPFTIKLRGIELRVFLRILRKETSFPRDALSPGESGCLIADISGPKRQWRCFLREDAGKIRADLRVFPEVSAKTLGHLKREAERFLKEGSKGVLSSMEFGEILVGNRDESASWMENLCSESLLSVNKEV